MRKSGLSAGGRGTSVFLRGRQQRRRPGPEGPASGATRTAFIHLDDHSTGPAVHPCSVHALTVSSLHSADSRRKASLAHPPGLGREHTCAPGEGPPSEGRSGQQGSGGHFRGVDFSCVCQALPRYSGKSESKGSRLCADVRAPSLNDGRPE